MAADKTERLSLRYLLLQAKFVQINMDWVIHRINLYQVQKCKNNIHSQLSIGSIYITDRTIQLLTPGDRYLISSQEILPCT